MITPTGFREYDAQWQYPDAINLLGITALGLGLGTQMQKRGIEPVIAANIHCRSKHADARADAGRYSRQGHRTGLVADGLFQPISP